MPSPDQPDPRPIDLFEGELQRWRGVVERCLAGASQTTEFEMRFISVGDRVASIVSAHCGDREVVRKKYDTASPPPDCTDLIDDIRDAHYDPDAGTFLLATITGRTIRDFTVRTETFDTTPPPQWAEITTADIVAESRRYPRNNPPAWWTDILTRNNTIDVRPRPGTATTFEMSERVTAPLIRAQFLAFWGAVARAVGAVFPVVTIDRDAARVTVDHVTRHFTICWFDDGRSVISGRSTKNARECPLPDLFIGAPEWLHPDLLDEPSDLDALTYCAWEENGTWAHSPMTSSSAIRTGPVEIRTPDHAAYAISYIMDPSVQRGSAELDSSFASWFDVVGIMNSRNIKPITGSEWIKHLDTRPPDRGPAEIDDAIDYLGSWDLLAPLGLTADDGPTTTITNQIATIQKTLGDNEVRVSIAGGSELLRWKNTPDDITAKQIRTQLRRLRQLMFRRDTGVWWDAEFTRTAAHFTNPGQRPEHTLPPRAYADDLHHMSAPTPGWLHDLWLSQTTAVLEPTPATPQTVTGLDPFPAVVGRWAALAGAIFALASDDERRTNNLPIRAGLDGLWYTTGDGQRLRLTPLHDGRAVLSGVPDPFTTTDPISVVTALPDWIPLDALHPDVAVSGLTICWWWDGHSWLHSPTAITTTTTDLRLPWITSTQATTAIIEQIATGSGIRPTPDRITQFVTTSETDPTTARTMLPRLFA